MKEKKLRITPETAQSVNEYLVRQCKSNKQRKLIQVITTVVSTIVFLCLSFLVIYGVICQLSPFKGDQEMTDALLNFPVVSNAWNVLNKAIPIFQLPWYFSIPLAAVLLLVPMYIIHLVTLVLVKLLFHPKAELEPLLGDTRDVAVSLANNHKRAVDGDGFLKFLPHMDFYKQYDVLPYVYAIIPSLGVMAVIVVVSKSYWYYALPVCLIPILVAAVIIWFLTLLVVGFRERIAEKAKDLYAEDIDKYWVENDPLEAERRAKIEAIKAENDRRKAEEYRAWLVSDYVQRTKEYEDYRRRLHQWATDDDDPKPGCGAGI